MFKRLSIIISFLLVVLAGLAYFVWSKASTQPEQANGGSASESLWQSDVKVVDLDQYIAANQVSQNIIDNKQRVMLEPELISFSAVLQDKVSASKAELVQDALVVWGISPLPEVGFSTYIRTAKGQILPVYVENQIADYLSTLFTPGAQLQLKAYRLYNYAKGPRLLLVGVQQDTAEQTKQNLTRAE